MAETFDRIGAIKVIDTLGRGANSTILKVRRDADGKLYALKKIPVQNPDDQKYIVQARNEFAVAQELDHPRLMKAFALELHRNMFLAVNGALLLLEFVDGQPLSHCGQLPLARLAVLFRRTADALAYMHGKSIYHADIKPENIMVTPEADVKVIDFGLAWHKGEEKDRVQGTLEYLAPEQARKKTVNAKTDIFNFGATMHRVLTGQPIPPAFQTAGASRVGNLDALVKPLQEWNADVPRDWDQLVRECLRFRPETRPATMQAVADGLRVVVRNLKATSSRLKSKPADQG